MTRAEWLKLECKPRPNVLAEIEKDLHRFKKKGETGQIFLCFTCDPYPTGIDTTVTREAIQLIHAHGFGVQILTKGGSRASRDFDLLGPADAFGVTLTFQGYQETSEWEPGAASPDSRLAALYLAHKAGIPTWASIEPVIVPEQSLYLIWAAHEDVDYFKIGTWNHDERAKAIDWADFGRRALELLEMLGKPCYIKADLRARMANV